MQMKSDFLILIYLNTHIWRVPTVLDDAALE